MIFGKKIELKVYVNQCDFLSDVHGQDFFCVFHELLMSFTIYIEISILL